MRVLPAVEVVGVDFYLGSKNQAPQAFGDELQKVRNDGLTLKMIDSRGTIVWPGGMSETFVIDNYRCRFEADGKPVSHAQIAGLYQMVTAAGYDIVKTESLRTFDGKPGFTLAQGQ
jgi:isocitrate dehydrogenase